MTYDHIIRLPNAAAALQVAEFYDICIPYAADVVSRCRKAAATNTAPSGCDCALCELVRDASTPLVTLDYAVPGYCAGCGTSVAHDAFECHMCGGARIARMVKLTCTVSIGPYSSGVTEVTPTLTSDLENEGYRVCSV